MVACRYGQRPHGQCLVCDGIQTSKLNIHKITRQPMTYNLHT